MLFLLRSAFEPKHRYIWEFDKLLTRQLKQMGIDFHRHNRGRLGRHHRRKRTRAGADFQHDVVACQLGGIDNDLNQIQIDKKILPMSRGGADAHLAETFEQKGFRLSGHNGTSRARQAVVGDVTRHQLVRAAKRDFSTYLASTSVSMFTRSPTFRRPSVVMESV